MRFLMSTFDEVEKKMHIANTFTSWLRDFSLSLSHEEKSINWHQIRSSPLYFHRNILEQIHKQPQQRRASSTVLQSSVRLFMRLLSNVIHSLEFSYCDFSWVVTQKTVHGFKINQKKVPLLSCNIFEEVIYFSLFFPPLQFS